MFYFYYYNFYTPSPSNLTWSCRYKSIWNKSRFIPFYLPNVVQYISQTPNTSNFPLLRTQYKRQCIGVVFPNWTPLTSRTLSSAHSITSLHDCKRVGAQHVLFATLLFLLLNHDRHEKSLPYSNFDEIIE